MSKYGRIRTRKNSVFGQFSRSEIPAQPLRGAHWKKFSWKIHFNSLKSTSEWVYVFLEAKFKLQDQNFTPVVQFHIKSSRAWHRYLSEFLHFCTICSYHWNMKTLKISAPNSSWFLRYRYLKIWAKYLLGTKIHHFEFTLSLITSALKEKFEIWDR